MLCLIPLCLMTQQPPVQGEEEEEVGRGEERGGRRVWAETSKESFAFQSPGKGWG